MQWVLLWNCMLQLVSFIFVYISLFVFLESVSERYRRTSYVGQNTTLPCHPRINKDVDWRYRPTETGFEDYVYSNGQMYERFRDRLTVVKSGDGDYDLIIRNVALSDAGLYICIEDLGLGVGYTYDLAVSGNLVLLTYNTGCVVNYYYWRSYMIVRSVILFFCEQDNSQTR